MKNKILKLLKLIAELLLSVHFGMNAVKYALKIDVDGYIILVIMYALASISFIYKAFNSSNELIKEMYGDKEP